MVAPLKMYTFGPIVMVKPNNLHTGGRLTHVGTMVFQLVLLKTHFIFFYHMFLQPPLRTSGAWLACSCCPPPSYCPRSSPSTCWSPVTQNVSGSTHCRSKCAPKYGRSVETLRGYVHMSLTATTCHPTDDDLWLCFKM